MSAGGNGGWDPRCASGAGYCGYDNVTQMTDLVKFPGAMRPAWTSGSAVGSSRGTAGGTFVSGAQWRDWNGALVVAMLSGRRLEVLRLTADGSATTGTAPLFDTLGPAPALRGAGSGRRVVRRHRRPRRRRRDLAR